MKSAKENSVGKDKFKRSDIFNFQQLTLHRRIEQKKWDGDSPADNLSNGNWWEVIRVENCQILTEENESEIDNIQSLIIIALTE